MNTCPICGGPAGRYRDGACSPGCDAVMGTDAGVSMPVFFALCAAGGMVFAAVVALVFRALGLVP